MSLNVFNHPKSINFCNVCSDNPSILIAFLLTKCDSLPSNFPLQFGLVHTRISVSLSLSLSVFHPQTGQTPGMQLDSFTDTQFIFSAYSI